MKWQHDEAVESPTLATSSPELVQDPRNEELLAEARILRQHKSRLETRMQILEDHNKQLESQLHRLRELLLQVQSRARGGHKVRDEDGMRFAMSPSPSSLQQSQMAMVQQHLPWLHLHISLKAARRGIRSTTPLTPKQQVRFGAPWLMAAKFTHRSARPFPSADEVEAKTQEVSVCLEDIMEKLRSAFPNSRGTRVKSPSLASYCSIR